MLALSLISALIPTPRSAAQSQTANSLTPSSSFSGICNASAGLALGKDLFVVADDEDKITPTDPLPLQIYSTSKPGQPVSVATIPAPALVLDPATSGELDLEGAARIGDRIYWLGSHSANS